MTTVQDDSRQTDKHDSLLTLIEKTYAVALNPEKLAEFLSVLDIFLNNKTADAQLKKEHDAKQIFPHFTQANEILERMDLSSDPIHMLETMPYPAWLCDEAGNIPYINFDAISCVGDANSINMLPISISNQQQLTDAIDDVYKQNNSHLINVALTGASDDHLPLIITPWGTSLKGSDLILVRIAVASWPANLSTAIQASYKLTDAEIDVLEALVKGYSSKEIAKLRQAKNETVRVQLKSIFRKTGTTSQVEVARLITGIVGASHFFNEPKQAPNHSPHTIKAPPYIQDRVQIQLPDGRHMTVYQCGAKQGDAFIYIHGYGDNALLTDDVAQLLAEHNLLAICPVRCGFGDSSACPAESPKVENLLQTTCNDLLFISEYFALKKTVYVGLYTGGIYAYAMAAIHEQYVSDVILITSPILPLESEEIRLVPINYQVHLRTTRTSPKAMHFIIKLYDYLVRSNNFSVIWSIYFEKGISNADPDQLLFLSNDFRKSYMESTRFVLAQGTEAMLNEWLLLSYPINPVAAVLEKPILMLRGSDDVFVSQQMVARRKMLYPNVTSKIIENAGAFLLFQNPQKVIKEIAKVVHSRES